MALRTAIILAGGQGVRLRPMTLTRPKPLLRMANLPLLEHILLGLKEQGITHFALATGYRSEQIKAYFGNGAKWGVEIRHFVEDEPLGSGGALRFVCKRAPEYSVEPFLVATADVLNDVDLTRALRLHHERGALATILCGPTDDPRGLGIVEMASNGRVTRFLEKPQPDETASRWANLAMWIFESDIMERVPPGFSRVEETLFPQLLEAGAPLYAFQHNGYWLDVGTLPRYLQAQRDAETGRFPCHFVAADYTIGAGAVVEASILYEGVAVGPGAQVRRCVIGPREVVPAGVVWEDRVLWREGKETERE
jgi:NDP-sugar pyrophosphorylase family protein